MEISSRGRLYWELCREGRSNYLQPVRCGHGHVALRKPCFHSALPFSGSPAAPAHKARTSQPLCDLAAAGAVLLSLSLFQQRQHFSFLFPSPRILFLFALKGRSVNLNVLLDRPH